MVIAFCWVGVVGVMAAEATGAVAVGGGVDVAAGMVAVGTTEGVGALVAIVVGICSATVGIGVDVMTGMADACEAILGSIGT